uniref:Syntaxin 11 n=1 Tax=Tetraodon nigroviridis TaxID=99883 RepID=H3DPQ5_TETNG
MRDRLVHLHQVQSSSEGFSTVELDAFAGCEEAGASTPDQHLEAVLQEAQQVRLEIQAIQNDVGELRDVNYQSLNETSFPAVTKRDSNSIGKEIKVRGEAVLRRLRVMDGRREELGQHRSLSSALRQVMSGYRDAEMSHREACKQQIRRQMEVVGEEVTAEDLEEMLEGGGWKVFCPRLEGRTARSALLQIEGRHQELLELEQRIRGIQELFLDVAVLVEQQGAGVDNIEKNVQSSGAIVQEGVMQLGKAAETDKNNPFKRLLCGCFPCYYK